MEAKLVEPRAREPAEAVTVIGENGTVTMTERDRRRAMKWWHERGVVGDDGEVTGAWAVTVGNAFAT